MTAGHQKSIIDNLDRFSNIIIDINRQEEYLAKKQVASSEEEGHPFVSIFQTFWPIIKSIL